MTTLTPEQFMNPFLVKVGSEDAPFKYRPQAPVLVDETRRSIADAALTSATRLYGGQRPKILWATRTPGLGWIASFDWAVGGFVLKSAMPDSIFVVAESHIDDISHIVHHEACHYAFPSKSEDEIQELTERDHSVIEPDCNWCLTGHDSKARTETKSEYQSSYWQPAKPKLTWIAY